jgi:hypothetical protein
VVAQNQTEFGEKVNASRPIDDDTVARLGSGLVIDMDRHVTRAVLFDTVGGHGRFISSSTKRSTILPPIEDGFQAARDAIRQVEADTGFSLSGDHGVESPRNGMVGVDFVALTGHPAEPVRLVFIPTGNAALLPVLLASARRTASVVEVLDSSARTEDGVLSGARMEAEIRRFRPDAVVILDGQNTQSEWATVVGTLSSLTAEGVVSQIIIVAREQYQQQAAQTMGEDADLRGIDPAEFDAADIAAAIELELNGLNESRYEIARLLPSTRQAGFTSRVRAGDLVTTFLARRRDQSVTVATIGDGVAIHAATPAMNLSGFRPDIDVHSSVRALLSLDARQVLSMLPYPLAEEDLRHWILNRSLRPNSVSRSSKDQIIECALTSAAIRTVWREIAGSTEHQHDVLIGGAALAEWNSPALALLCLLNAFQPESASGLIEVHLDRDGMLYSAGAVGDLSPALAADVVERDLLSPLASVIVVRSEGAEGDLAVQGEITYESGKSRQFSVPSGSVQRLELGPDESAVVTLQCEANVSIGSSGKGESVVFGEQIRLRGGDLGVVIDARTSAQLNGNDMQNQPARVTGWMSDLGEKELAR